MKDPRHDPQWAGLTPNNLRDYAVRVAGTGVAGDFANRLLRWEARRREREEERAKNNAWLDELGDMGKRMVRALVQARVAAVASSVGWRKRTYYLPLSALKGLGDHHARLEAVQYPMVNIACGKLRDRGLLDLSEWNLEDVSAGFLGVTWELEMLWRAAQPDGEEEQS